MTVDVVQPSLFGGSRRAALGLSGPARSGVERVSDRIGLAWDGLAEHPELEAENERLRAQLAVVASEPGRQADAEAELRRLLAGSELSYAPDLPAVVSRVVSDRRSLTGRSIEINKGSSSGLAEGMPVVTALGLVGVTTIVSADRSVVTLITEEGSAIGVRVADGLALVTGRGQDRALAISYEPGLGPRVEAGARVVTSGVDRSLYPGNLPVGEIGAGDEARVVPFADFDDLSYVTVLLWRAER